MTFLQRFGGAPQLNLHDHVIAIEGVFLDRTEQGLKPSFVKGEPPSDADVANVVQKIGRGSSASIAVSERSLPVEALACPGSGLGVVLQKVRRYHALPYPPQVWRAKILLIPSLIILDK